MGARHRRMSVGALGALWRLTYGGRRDGRCDVARIDGARFRIMRRAAPPPGRARARRGLGEILCFLF